MQIYMDGEIKKKIINGSDFIPWWNVFREELVQAGKLVYSTTIDGTTAYDTDIEYISKNVNHISELRIQTITMKDAINETLDQIRTYVERIFGHKENLVSIFYGKVSKKDWKLFGEFTEGLQWLHVSLNFLNSLIKEVGLSREMVIRIDEKIDRLGQHINNINDALIQEDFIWGGDIITYEFFPLFESINELAGDIYV
ncbi:hypothetical protein L3476_23595 [Paenibacillus thiaminolyticus]|uniref:hypothetical protein n=1 Tax=Paenibacillus thiaminolyticus TaxID=49283 RepID=UPI0011627EA7|nr:hypothetical protein [Paenibacillus thiaminolyticus]NGP58748.1 hypothetical protein [Paenibacillus thiaminolyticus]WCR26227.1 hypothetical protein L3476_23595 [Paenibacillus thiaminolyticus]